MRKADQTRQGRAREVRQWTVESLRQRMVKDGIEHAYITYENGEISLSHPALLRPVRAFLELSLDFANHEGIFIGREGEIPTLFFAFVHETRRGLAQGGLRWKPYPSIADVLEDGLRLSQGMTRKNALAGLWWGGGKGIIPLTEAMETEEYRTEGTPARQRLFEAYGRFIASIGGLYYTAEDVGTKTSDMDTILRQNRFVTCISSSLGGSGNPSPFTARGVYLSMQAAWRFRTGKDRLAGVRVAVQGAGNVGRPLIDLLDDAGAQVWACDPQDAALEALRQERPRVQIVELEEIYDVEAEIFAPCAVGNVVNVHTIPRLKVKLVCGAANNILGEEADAERLRERGIDFVPDYLCNRMGITNCCDEWQGYLAEDVALAAERVYPDTLRVLKHARNLVITTTRAADELADIAASELHPLLGHRGRRLIDDLRHSGWAGRGSSRNPGKSTAPFQPQLDEPRIRLHWEREGVFRGNGPRLAAAPISAASRPHLGSFLSALLMDVRARHLDGTPGGPPQGEERCRRLVGSEPGGLALQLAVERSLPYEREEIGRAEFVEACRDLHRSHDAAIREQLSQLGVGFDPQGWLDPLNAAGSRAVRRLFFALQDAGLLRRERRLSYHCPHCGTVRVASDVKPTHLKVRQRYTLQLLLPGGDPLPVVTLQPELLAGAVAVTVCSNGPYGNAAGREVHDPIYGRSLPVVAIEGQESDAALLVPSHSRHDERAAREAGLSLPAETAAAFDATGRICLPGDREAKLPAEARRALAQDFPEVLLQERGDWTLDARRCRRCSTLVNPYPSEELFLDLESGRDALRAALHSGAISFAEQRWRRLFEGYLQETEAMCISRQQWWGNPLPAPQGEEGEVLSTWFSLVAWSLQGDTPIEEVFVDPYLLHRWVLPSQLIALAWSGRPAFRKVVVHGTVHVVDRQLKEIEGATEKDPDEERFLYRTTLQPMRKQLGNVVEPATLVRRFGADALRLGYLLSLTEQRPEVVTLAESSLRLARKTVQRLIGKFHGLGNLVPPAGDSLSPLEADPWLAAWCQGAAALAREALDNHRPAEAAYQLVTVAGALGRYAQALAQLPPEAAQRQSLAPSLGQAITLLGDAFHPLCPFLWQQLQGWAQERGWNSVTKEEADPQQASGRRAVACAIQSLNGAGTVEIAAPQPEALGPLEEAVEMLSTLHGSAIRLVEEPSRGHAVTAGPYVVVRRGKLRPPHDDSEAAQWYRSLHTVPIEARGGSGR